eukprot:GEMP01004649.1.p1 GENE.GEMP01004649.1~~GEMP01004649.1.p1  ORF type:complete len:899 (+),score=161.54 GEMP01004649.1:626-3322(+)
MSDSKGGKKGRGSNRSSGTAKNARQGKGDSAEQKKSAIADINEPLSGRAPTTVFGEVELTRAEHMQELRNFCVAFNYYQSVVKTQKKSNDEFGKVWKDYEHMMKTRSMPVSETITENKMQCLKDWGNFVAYHEQVLIKFKELPLRQEWKRKLVKLAGSKFELPPVSQIRSLNKERVALEAILVDNTHLLQTVIGTINQTAGRRLSERGSVVLSRAVRGQQMLKPEKDWKSLDYAVKQLLHDITHPYMKVTEITRENVIRTTDAITVQWETKPDTGTTLGEMSPRSPKQVLTDLTKPSNKRAVTGNATTGFSLSVQKKWIKKTSRYDEAIYKLAASYQMAILAFMDHLSKEDDAPKKLCIPLLNMETSQLSVDLDPLVNLSCLCLGMARVPMASYKYTIQLLAPTDAMVNTFTETLDWKKRLLNVNFIVPSRANLVSAKYASYDWLKNSMQPFDKLQRVMIAFQTTTAAWVGGYHMFDTPHKLKYVPYMIKETWIEKGDVSQKLTAEGKFHRTRLLLLPGSFGPDRNVMEVSTQCAQNGKKVVAVNAASAYSTGGGILTGGRHAMEEGWCVQSSILPSLIHALPLGMATKSTLYERIAEGLPRWTPDGSKRIFHRHFPEDSVVVSPRVEIFRSPFFDGYQFLESPVVLQGVVSCAAYNFNKNVTDAPLDAPRGKGKYADGMRKKLHAVMQAAIKLEGDVLVISDIGTGVFRNNSQQVGTAVGEMILQAYGCFQLVILLGTQSFCDAATRASRVPETSIEGKHVGKKSNTRDVVSDCLRILDSARNDVPDKATEGVFMDTIASVPGSLKAPNSPHNTAQGSSNRSGASLKPCVTGDPRDSSRITTQEGVSVSASDIASQMIASPAAASRTTAVSQRSGRPSNSGSPSSKITGSQNEDNFL